MAGLARRQGVGRALLACGDRARDHPGHASDGGDRRGFRPFASIELHRRAGFRLVGTLESVGWKFGRWLDTVIMQRPLGDGATVPAPDDSR